MNISNRRLLVIALTLMTFSTMFAASRPAFSTEYIDVDNYCWIEGDHMDIGFSKYGEMIGYNEDTETGLGIQYPGYESAGNTYDQTDDTAVDPFCNEYIGTDWWMNGWFIDIKTRTPDGRDREIWAMALFSDGAGRGGDWIVMPSVPSSSSARPLWQEYPPYANPDSYEYAGIVDPIPPKGGRKTNGLCTTDPIEIVYNGPGKFEAVCRTRISDVGGAGNLVDLTFTFIFNKAQKNVIIQKDVKRLYPKQPMNIQFGNRGEWDLGLAGDTDSYVHWYTGEPVQYWDTDGDGVINGTEVETTFEVYKDYFLTNKHPEKWWDEVPDEERPTQVFNEWSEVLEDFPETWLEAQNGSCSLEGHMDPTVKEDSYAVAQVIARAGDYVGALGVWPHPEFWGASYRYYPPARTRAPWGNNPSSIPLPFAPISRMLEWHKWTVEQDPNQGEEDDLDDRDDIWVIGDDIRMPDGSTLEPIIPFVIYEHDFQLSYTFPEYRVVSAYVLTDCHDADDADADDPGNEESWSSGQNVIDWEIQQQLDGIFSPTSGPVYIRPDGSIDPPTAPILRDGDLYTLTNNITFDADGIVIERNNMTLDGAGYAIQGPGFLADVGVKLSGRVNVTIGNTEITAFGYAISLTSSSNNRLVGNNVTANTNYGIRLDSSSNNTINGNTIADNTFGIRLDVSDYNIVESNTVNSSAFDGVQLIQSDDNEVCGNEISVNGMVGIWTFQCSDNIISGNTAISNTIDGISLSGSNSTTVTDNKVADNNRNGIMIWDYPLARPNNNMIARNIALNNGYGICLEYSSNNTLFGNTVTDNSEWGIYINTSSNSTIYHNSFINTKQVYSYDSINTWDDGYPSGGNYWSEYVDTDYFCGQEQDIFGSDGVWDSPCVIDVDNTDNFPLVEPYVSGNLSVLVSTDKYTYHAGETMHLGLNITNPDSVKYLCFAVWCTLPDSSIYLVIHQHSVVLPIGLEYSNPSFKVFTLPILPSGAYTWHAAFLERATHTIIAEDTAEWEFS